MSYGRDWMQVMAFLEGDTAAPPARKKSRTKGKVVVIGAGPAGLSAAMHLKVRPDIQIV